MISEQTRQKMRLAKLGKPGNGSGTKRTIESKIKMSEARKEYYKRVGGMPDKTKMLLRKIALRIGSGKWMKGKIHVRDEEHHLWKGSTAGYGAIHSWVRRRKPKPYFCEQCGQAPPRDLANISQKYKRDVDDFEWLCRKCHMLKDGRIKKLQ